MELPTIQRGKRKVVRIKEGQVFCLPSRVPHSPQRPEEGSLGLVVERERYVKGEFGIKEPELDGLRWFVDFDNTDGSDVLWEKYFHCYDLGRDLVPVVKEYHASEEKQSRIPTPGKSVLPEDQRPFVIDEETEVPDPFDLQEWIASHAADLAANPSGVNLFGEDHPDGEFKVLVASGDAEYNSWEGDTWIFQIEGNCDVWMNGETNKTNAQQLLKGVGGVVPPNTPFRITRDATEGAGKSIGFIVRNDPRGNKREGESQTAGQKE